MQRKKDLKLINRGTTVCFLKARDIDLFKKCRITVYYLKSQHERYAMLQTLFYKLKFVVPYSVPMYNYI